MVKYDFLEESFYQLRPRPLPFMFYLNLVKHHGFSFLHKFLTVYSFPVMSVTFQRVVILDSC